MNSELHFHFLLKKLSWLFWISSDKQRPFSYLFSSQMKSLLIITLLISSWLSTTKRRPHLVFSIVVSSVLNISNCIYQSRPFCPLFSPQIYWYGLPIIFVVLAFLLFIFVTLVCRGIYICLLLPYVFVWCLTLSCNRPCKTISIALGSLSDYFQIF